MTVFQNVLFKLNSLSPISNYRCHLVNRLSTTNVINYPPKQTLEDKLGIPPKPKRPKTPFLKFVTENRLRFLQQNPEATAPVVIKQLAEEWKTVSDSVKEKMCEEFSKEREKYLESLRRYEKLLTPVDKEEIAKAKLEEKREKEKRALKKKKEELGCPKKPATSYILFMKSKLPERGDTPFSEFQKQIKSGWSALPPPEKTRFETIYKKEMEAYREKMDLWTAQMKEKGIKLSEENSKMSKPKDTPRKPGLPFTYFQKIRFQERGNIPQLEFQKQLADEWAHLSPKEKKKYEDMHQKDMEQYKLKMESWSKSRESKLKPGEIRAVTSPPHSGTCSSDLSQTEVREERDSKEEPPSPANTSTSETVPKSTPPIHTQCPPHDQLTPRQIIVFSITISITLVVVFSVYIILFY